MPKDELDSRYWQLERERVQKMQRNKNLNLCAVWMERDGFPQETEHLRRMMSGEPLAYLWAVIYINKTLEGDDRLQVYLMESKSTPLLRDAALKVLGREVADNETFLIRGPFHWPDPEAMDGAMAEVQLETA